MGGPPMFGAPKGGAGSWPFNLDLFYFGLKRKAGVFGQGIGEEKRSTVGARIWHGGLPFGPPVPGWDYDVEYAYQFGKFGPGPRLGPTFPFQQFAKGDIRAWTLATQTGYTFFNLPLRPRIGLNTGITTGDKDHSDPDVQTFFTPFPNGRFFGAAQQQGPLNIQGIRPNVTIQLPRGANLTVDTFFFWRQSLNDGLYNIPGFLIRPGDLTRSRYVATQPGAEVFWPATKHVTLAVAFAYSAPGKFLKENPPADKLSYLGLIMGYRF
jgi:hypothetical protein